jgi:hypothetical protein
MNNSSYNEIVRLIKQVWDKALTDLSDIAMHINLYTPTIIYPIPETGQSVYEYTISFLNPVLYQELYSYASKIDELTYWYNIEMFSMYKETFENIDVFYLKWGTFIEINITEEEFNNWKQIFIKNMRAVSYKSTITNNNLKVLRFLNQYIYNNIDSINNINELTDNETKEEEKN